jgi:hypothetical protein
MHKFLFILLAGISMQSCRTQPTTTWKNDHIDSKTRSQIKTLNDKLMKAGVNKDVAAVKAIMSEACIRVTGDRMDSMISGFNSLLKGDQYSVMDEYYVMDAVIDTIHMATLSSGSGTDSDYYVHYPALQKEIYISFLVPKGTPNRELITVIYGKIDGTWKVNYAQFFTYGILDKTLPELYRLAKESYANSYLMDALDYIILSKDCISPAGPFLQYQKLDEMLAFYNKMKKEADAKYPYGMEFKGIKSKPHMYRAFAIATAEYGMTPRIEYISSVDFSDTIAQNGEFQQVKKEVYSTYTGLDKDKKAVFFWVLSDMPDKGKPIKQRLIIDKLSK